MKTFIFTFALIACLMLAMGTAVDETTDGAVEVVMPLVKAVTNQNCNNIGGACTLSDDCCSLRCHAYRKRCVS